MRGIRNVAFGKCSSTRTIQSEKNVYSVQYSIFLFSYLQVSKVLTQHVRLSRSHQLLCWTTYNVLYSTCFSDKTDGMCIVSIPTYSHYVYRTHCNQRVLYCGTVHEYSTYTYSEKDSSWTHIFATRISLSLLSMCETGRRHFWGSVGGGGWGIFAE